MLDLTLIFTSPTTPESSHDSLTSMSEGEFVCVGGTLFRLAEEKYHAVEKVTVTKKDTNVSMSDEKYNIEELKVMINDEEAYPPRNKRQTRHAS